LRDYKVRNSARLTFSSFFDPIRPGGPTRTSADVSVPRLAGFSLDHLIILFFFFFLLAGPVFSLLGEHEVNERASV